MEKVDNKIDNIIAKLQQVLEKNNTLKKEVSSVKTKSSELEIKNNELEKITKFENQLKEGNSNLVSGLTEKERVDIKKKIKSYIADIDGFLTKQPRSMADEMVNINVVIADRPYRLKINQEEEDKVRDIAKAINDKIKEYTQVFSSKDKQDFLAMIALQNGVEAMKSKGVDGSQVMEEMENVSSRLDQLDELLDLALSR